MDRNTTTGLILIGAVMVAFFMLNQPPQQNIQEEKAEKQIQKESDIEQKESLEIVVNDTNSNSLSVEDSIIGAKLAEQKEQQRLINEFGVFYKAGIGIEKDFTLQNDKISLAISSKGGSINEAKMIEKSDDGKYKYKTHHDFVNEIEEPLSLFEKGSSTMSLVVEDIENSSLIYTKDLFFANLYDQFFLKCQSIFGDFKLSLKNSRTCHCYLDRKRYYLPSVYHNHISTSTINGVYYLDVGEGDSISFIDDESDKEEVYYVSTGELLIFANHLVHKPNRPTHDGIRYSLNMEIMTDESAEEIFSRDRLI